MWRSNAIPNGNVEKFCGRPTSVHEISRRLRVFRRMCRCVSRMHHLGCGHRDLKPGNFFVGAGDVIKLGDFGTARLFTPLEPSLVQMYAGPVGDLRYAAPEALACLNVNTAFSQRADVYALGAILFEMLTGRPLFEEIWRNIGQLHQFSLSMATVGEQQREKVFLGLIDKTSWSIPQVRALNPDIPRCVHHQLESGGCGIGSTRLSKA